MIPFPNKKYNIIYADPAWAYRVHVKDNNNPNRPHGAIRNANHYYNTMSTEEIKNLPVNEIADKNCILFLWVTNPLLPEGLEVIKSWGFEYKTVGFVWMKTYKKSGKIWVGMGHYTRSSAELCLIATKGRVPVINRSIRQGIIAPVEEHSKKPAEVRDLIVKMYGDLPRIELFARQTSLGWDYWGNQIPVVTENEPVALPPLQPPPAPQNPNPVLPMLDRKEFPVHNYLRG
jgi:N6-adenosine-specific RNA methylase IME4